MTACPPHDWFDTGVNRQHFEDARPPLFKYGAPVVTYVKCRCCGQIGFRKPNRPVVYTWEKV
jgi:hypothetical protein